MLVLGLSGNSENGKTDGVHIYINIPGHRCLITRQGLLLHK